MKRSIDETADRFDEMSEDYDETRSKRHLESVEWVVDVALEDASQDDTVVDIGAGTGIVSLGLAPHVDKVYGIDISEGMLDKARRKADERSIDNAEFGTGGFRKPEQEFEFSDVDVIVSNFAMHHLSDEEKKEAIEKMKTLLGGSGRIVLGDVILFEELDDPSEHYSPEVDDPSNIDFLENAFLEAGFTVRVEKLGPSTGVIEAEIDQA